MTGTRSRPSLRVRTATFQRRLRPCTEAVEAQGPPVTVLPSARGPAWRAAAPSPVRTTLRPLCSAGLSRPVPDTHAQSRS